ncbi:hypothetical protein B296_00010786 [Ensete ventricosum]|uniref:Uncharacterized protein n=1 Tax=Ensete ventricosum TaxID=4639 RepID=A0A426ZQ01_ENSVE|nr:hypothetical protein B296_00010786 [Ensete ventricosum]
MHVLRIQNFCLPLYSFAEWQQSHKVQHIQKDKTKKQGDGEPEGQAAEVGVEQVAEVGVGDDLVIAAVEQPLVYFVPYGVAGGGAAEGPRGRRALALAFLHVGRGAGAPRLGLGSGSGSAHADGPKLGFRMKGKQEEGSPAVKEHWKAAEIPEEEKARREEKAQDVSALVDPDFGSRLGNTQWVNDEAVTIFNVDVAIAITIYIDSNIDAEQHGMSDNRKSNKSYSDPNSRLRLRFAQWINEETITNCTMDVTTITTICINVDKIITHNCINISAYTKRCGRQSGNYVDIDASDIITHHH